MELSEEITIPAPMAKVYDSLNDIAILKACIPGCEELVKHSDTELEARVVLKIGPVKAKFSGKVTLDTTHAPDRFSLAGAGDGGIAGARQGKPCRDVDIEVRVEGGVAHGPTGEGDVNIVPAGDGGRSGGADVSC